MPIWNMPVISSPMIVGIKVAIALLDSLESIPTNIRNANTITIAKQKQSIPAQTNIAANKEPLNFPSLSVAERRVLKLFLSLPVDVVD